jgi:ParB family transcriptional regulator, chromosome partitioning protein
MVKVQRGLGKGLSALIAEANTGSVAASTATLEMERPQEIKTQTSSAQPSGLTTLEISKLTAGVYQPRNVFSEEPLHELAQSIEQKGIIQPLIVRQTKSGGYEIIAGERRFRAAQMAGLKEVPVIIKKMTDDDALEVALIENVQRQDLNPLEEARGYERLIREFQYTQEEIGQSVGKSRSHIANLLRLLKLPEEVKTMLENGDLTMGHARALLAAKDPLVIANQIVNGGLNVRAAEAMAKGRATDEQAAVKRQKKPQQHEMQPRPKDPDILALEETLSENLGLKVSIEDRGAGGEVLIAYETLADLDRVLQLLGGSI